jgi:uncharacterized protein YyaL (SSP411 family)
MSFFNHSGLGFPAVPLVSVLLALGLASCGRKDPPSTTKLEVSVGKESGPMPEAGTANRLNKEQSAFMRHHAQDPVDWYPWGDEAFAKAKKEQKIVFVSIGYMSCPWSQKMQDESFRDPAIARFMNRQYVNVLVDREERPDVNNSYLHYVFSTTRKSGWPLNLWLTPEGLPVFSGVYFPTISGNGNVAFSIAMENVANNFLRDPGYIKRQADTTYKDYLADYRKNSKSQALPLTAEALGLAFEKLRAVYDPVNGGFSPPPKFPQPQTINYLLGYAARLGADRLGRAEESRQMLSLTLDSILRGGVYDQLGGGVHRYSTDIYWALPQFEKMLYDQGFLAETLVNAGQVLDRPAYETAAREIFRYADSELAHPEGGFYCAEGSISPIQAEGKEMSEGAFYLWQLPAVEQAAGAGAMPLLNYLFGLDGRGNIPIDSPTRARFPRANVLKLEHTLAETAAFLKQPEVSVSGQWQEARKKLGEARGKRPRPLLDNKVVAGWNGTMIAALARAGWVYHDDVLIARATKAADFILKRLKQEDGSLGHAFLDGPSAAPGCSEDYAHIIRGMLELYEASGDPRWLRTAVDLQDQEIKLLWDTEEGGFFDGPQQNLLFNRMKSVDETTEFAPVAVSTMNLIRLSHLAGRAGYLEKATKVVDLYGGLMMRAPAVFLRLLQAYDVMVNPLVEVVVTGAPNAPDRAAMLDELRRTQPVGRVLVYLDGGEAQAWLTKMNPELARLPAATPGQTTVHLCRKFAVIQSFTKPEGIRQALEKMISASVK